MAEAPFSMPVRDERHRCEWLVWVPTERDRKRALTNHDQTLEHLKSRHGMSWCEMAAILEDRPWHRMEEWRAQTAVVAEITARLRASLDAGTKQDSGTGAT